MERLPLTIIKRANHGVVAGIAFVLLACGGGMRQIQAADSSGPEPWTDKQLIEPAQLAKIVGDPAAPKPVILDIGPVNSFRGGPIKGAIVVGSANEPQNLQKLREVVSHYPKDADLVIYCGCCPFKDCPNIRPAFKLLQEMKFTQPRLLNIPKNLKTDWIKPGYPTEK